MARILLIDDDEPVRTILRLMLMHQGHTVVEARNGREGLQIFQADQTDLVITDLIMPEAGGFDVVAELRRKVPALKILVISGGVRGRVDNYLQTALHLGADHAMAKPFSRAQLNAAVNHLLPTVSGPAREG